MELTTDHPAWKLGHARIEELRQMFTMFDHDRDNLLLLEQATKAWRMVGLKIDRYNVEVTGERFPLITFPIFAENVFHFMYQATFDAEVQRLFNLLDREKRGFVTQGDVRQFFSDANIVVKPEYVEDLYEEITGTLLHRDRMMMPEFKRMILQMQEKMNIKVLEPVDWQ